MKPLTQEYVRELLGYNPETGELRWNKYKRGRRKSGTVGSVNRAGYLRFDIDRRSYLTHRVIWLWWYGHFPENDIDHINRNKTDNSISNLREVSRSCNMRNCETDRTNSSGVKGVCWDRRKGKWEAKIVSNCKTRYLDYHNDFVEAVAHRLMAEQCLDWADCDANSSAYRYMREYVKAVKINTMWGGREEEMNQRTIYYHTTKDGYELVCPEDGHVKFEETVGNFTVLGVLTCNEFLQYGFRVWVFHRQVLYMVAVSSPENSFNDLAVMSDLRNTFKREVKQLG